LRELLEQTICIGPLTSFFNNKRACRNDFTHHFAPFPAQRAARFISYLCQSASTVGGYDTRGEPIFQAPFALRQNGFAIPAYGAR
jgi:hypothetical protein